MGLPRLMLWAWERPEDLRFIAPQTTGVAFLAGTIRVLPWRALPDRAGDQGVILRPRLQPLRVTPGTRLEAVVRIEALRPEFALPPDAANDSLDSRQELALRDSQVRRIVAILADIAERPHVSALQIDFDALRSQRFFYLSLLEALRTRLPSTPISITALASWCLGDRWLAQLPAGTVNEIVPMLFRMGPASARIADAIQNGSEFTIASCRGSLGLSTDEQFSRSVLQTALYHLPAHSPGKRIYLFRPASWTAKSLTVALGESPGWPPLLAHAR